MTATALLETDELVKRFPIPTKLSEYFRRTEPRAVHAVDGVSLSIAPGETLGLIGESGSGKTTFGWLVSRLLPATSGRVRFDGVDVTELSGTELRSWRRNVQIVFQDPVGSLDPRMRVWQIVGEPIEAQGAVPKAQLRSRVTEILPMVGLPVDCLDQYPHEFSGGGRQRISLA
ncbi:MAG: ATP-binding cassette domain-containing protein, partial [Thermoplasmata archaeon]